MPAAADRWRVTRLHHVAFAHEGDAVPGVLAGLLGLACVQEEAGPGFTERMLAAGGCGGASPRGSAAGGCGPSGSPSGSGGLPREGAVSPRGSAAGDSYLQLLEATGPGTVERFVRRRGPGLHHVAFEVSDIDAAVADLRARGVRMVDETPRPGGMGTRIAFVHPAACPGLLLELVGPPAGDHTTERP